MRSFLAALLVSLSVAFAAGAQDAGGPAARSMLPDLIFADGSGMPVHLSQYRGQVVVINFWAGWCGPCVKELPFLDRLQSSFGQVPLTVMTVAEDQGGITAARQFFARQKLGYLRPFADPGGTAAQLLGVTGLPTSIIVDRHGRQVLRVAGPYQWDSPQIASRLRFLLAEP